ncbi:uncharacterized protein LOC134211461 isoform X1 [Armigeres subalbatus]|uniref:uncharacterized protein LOC134211461 isoform X1 n=1 Tax=Armigeres subalbatus TaxID=124917 RepID=UPI002ED41547
MNQNYVQKCEEYLENIPPQKETLSSPVPGQQRVDSTCVNRRIAATTTPTAINGGRGQAASRKLVPGQPFVRGKLSINNRGGVDVPGSIGKVKKTSNLNQQKKQTDSKFIRSCHRPDQQQPERLQRILLDKAPCVRTGPNVGTGARGRENASDNVNQPDNVKPSLVASASKLKGNYAIGAVEAELGRQQQNAKSVTTDSWDGILTSTNTGMSLAQIKSKERSHHIESSSIGVPPGPPSTSTSTASSSCSMTRPTSSIVAVPPQPRRPPAVAPQQLSRKMALCKSSELETDGINLFRFDPLRTLQFLTLELKSKLKALNSSTTGSSPELKQLYKISKELLLAVKILTESWNDAQMASRSCKHCEKFAVKPSDKDVPLTIDPMNTSTIRCTSCENLKSKLDQKTEIHTQQTKLLNDEINYLKAKLLTLATESTEQQPTDEMASTEQPEPESGRTNLAAPSSDQQLQQWLEGEIKRLQTMISDKQTLQDGLIDDLHRKLQEANSRCRRLEQSRNESEKRLLYASLENERLNFLLNTQASTMTNLQSDFSAIESLAHQQADLLQDRIQSPPNGTRTSATRSPIGNNKASNPIITIIDNHHCNYRHPSGAIPSSSRTSCSSSPLAVAADDCHRNYDNRNQQPFSSPSWQRQSSNSDSTSTRGKPDARNDDAVAAVAATTAAGKLRKQRRHYRFKNNAEKESDDGNDANDLASQPPSPSFRSMTLSLALEATKPLDDCNGIGGSTAATSATFQRNPDDIPGGGDGADAVAPTRRGAKTRTYFNSAPPALLPPSVAPEPLSSSKSLSSAGGFARIRSVRRPLLIDSDCEQSVLEQEPPFNSTGAEPMRTPHAIIDCPMAPSGKRYPHRQGGPVVTRSYASSSTTDDKHGSSELRIGFSKTNNNCASLGYQRPEQQQQHQQLPPPGLGHLMASVVAGEPSSPSSTKSKKDNDDDNRATVEEKYPRDYGDKFERRESCLPQLSLSSGKELCQNRPIIGQIRQEHSASADAGGAQATNGTKTEAQLERDAAKVPAEGRKAISVANESASAPQRTEEFSIDFDDITLPTSPTPFQGGSLSSIAENLRLDDDSNI